MRRAGLKALVVVFVKNHFRRENRRLTITEIGNAIRCYHTSVIHSIIHELIREGRLRNTGHQWRFVALPFPS